ncbi:hypothetical protein J4573_18470 [Actinomadura barringtoniae]|uniref:Uncharacterized protein n=1 Tax=Actinomadura barringtoniae TaxID=1427535 RepID=A0A939TAI0_9ACTN|nr:hypothetical protein [Actinomadura barringtoniae]MBO2449095.1 hypothetical protein [Actinomadura barringtoniae]
MSRDNHSGLRCPHCQAALTLVPAAPGKASTATAPAPISLVLRDEQSPPPVAEVLADYASRVRDGTTAARGAAKVRASLDRARQKETTRRATQRAARQGFRTA